LRSSTPSHRLSSLAVLLAGALAAGCGDETVPPPAPPAPPEHGQPIEAPREQWAWVPFANAFCADGNPTGLAVNLTDRSPNAVIFLMGGGACWDYQSCYESALATYVASGFTEFDMPVLEVAAAGVGLLSRDDPHNPFRDYSVVAVPYCTGDAFTGSRTAVYAGHPTSHVGHSNVMAYLERLVPTFSRAERVVVVGVSAGGIGAAFNWWHIQKAFGDVRVDMIDDSGPAFRRPFLEPELESTWRNTWGIDQGLPASCSECRQELDALVSFAANEAPKSRGALLSYTADSVLPGFLQISEEEFTAGLDALAAERLEGLPRARYFFIEGSGHVTLFHPDLAQNGVRLWDWIPTMIGDDPGWSSVRP
jgi:hypothetical protein